MDDQEPRNKLIDLSNILPIGHNIQPLIGNSDLSLASVKQMLRERGFAITNGERVKMTNLMVQSLITPQEFLVLLSKLKKREESLKERNEILPLNKTDFNFTDLVEIGGLDIEKASTDPFGNFELAQYSSGTITNSPQGKTITYPYTIYKNSLSSDYIQGLRIFHGSIEFTQPTGSNELIIRTQHSSKDTQSINKVALKKFKKRLKKAQITTSIKTEKIKFGSFSNEGRVRFLLNCGKCDFHSDFSFEKVTDLEVKPDDSLKLSEIESLAWLENKVSSIKLKGSALEETFFFTEMKCRKYLKIWKLECSYKFEHADGTSVFSVIYDFDNFGRSSDDSCLFQLAISDIKNPPHKFGSSDYHALKTNISKLIHEAKEMSYTENSRTKPK